MYVVDDVVELDAETDHCGLVRYRVDTGHGAAIVSASVTSPQTYSAPR